MCRYFDQTTFGSQRRQIKWLTSEGEGAVSESSPKNVVQGENFQNGTAIVHPGAHMGTTVKLARGVVVCVGAIATTDIEIGGFSQLN